MVTTLEWRNLWMALKKILYSFLHQVWNQKNTMHVKILFLRNERNEWMIFCVVVVAVVVAVDVAVDVAVVLTNYGLAFKSL